MVNTNVFGRPEEVTSDGEASVTSMGSECTKATTSSADEGSDAVSVVFESAGPAAKLAKLQDGSDVSAGTEPSTSATASATTSSSWASRPRPAGSAGATQDDDDDDEHHPATDDRWWCDSCVGAARPSCSVQHAASVMGTTAGRAAMQARLVPARKAVRAAGRRLDRLQRAADAMEEVLAGRGPRLLLYFDGYWDEHEHGILDGFAPLELLAEKPLTEDQRAQVCASLTGLELSLDVEREELAGPCPLPATLLESLFASRPAEVDLKPGAVLCANGQLTIHLRRVPSRGRLLGYVEAAGLRALTVDRGWCEGRCQERCVLCHDHIAIRLRVARFDARRDRELQLQLAGARVTHAE